MLSGSGRSLLEEALPAWLARQRWFGAKTRAIVRVEIGQWVILPVADALTILPTAAIPAASTLGDVILLLDMTYTDGSTERYQLPLAYAAGAELHALKGTAPASVVLEVESPTGPAAFHDAVVREEFRQALLALVEHGGALPLDGPKAAAEHVAATLIAAHESRPAHDIAAPETHAIASAIEAKHSIEIEVVAPAFVGHMPGDTHASTEQIAASPKAATGVRGFPSTAFAEVRGGGSLAARIGSAEQSNTNILYGQQIIMKMFRRLQPGLNPDIEIGRFLTDVARFDRIAPLLGEITLDAEDGSRTSLAMVQGLVANEGDGWQWTQGELAKFFAGTETFVVPADYLAAAALLGCRTAEMHLALATTTDDPAFAAEPFTQQDYELDGLRIEAQIVTALTALEAGVGGLHPQATSHAIQVIAQRAELLQAARDFAQTEPSGQRIRIHGDYHLGQTLRAQNDFVLLDFEGEPARSLEERRRKQCPLRDVAGMLRSFSYAAASALNACEPSVQAGLASAAQAWENAVCEHFLDAYLATASSNQQLLPEPAAARLMLQGYVLEKALYELLYELNNRPAWVGIPLSGILALSPFRS